MHRLLPDVSNICLDLHESSSSSLAEVIQVMLVDCGRPLLDKRELLHIILNVDWFLRLQCDSDKLQKIIFTHRSLCFLKVLIWRTRELMFLMGKIQSRHSGCQTPPSLLLIPPRIFAHPHSLHPRVRRPSLLLSTHRSSYQQLLLPSQPLPPPTWSVACRRSGGCPSLAWTRVSYVSRGRRTAASFTDELDTWFPAMSAPGSWRRGTRCVRCAGCRSSRSSSPTSAETDRPRM